MSHCIISIGREFGSGGHKIGQMVSDRLNIPYYDNELLLLAAQYGDMSCSDLSAFDEKKHNPFLFHVNYEGNASIEKRKSKEDTLNGESRQITICFFDSSEMNFDEIAKKIIEKYNSYGEGEF